MRWLTVIGMGEDGVAGLSPAARSALEKAEIVIGGDRHPDLGAGIRAERRSWPHPFEALIDELHALKPRRPVLLVAGDPLWYSIGARITHAIPADEITFFPAVSSFQYAAARLGWSLADCETLTAHRRPPGQIVPHFWPGARLLVLSEGPGTPGALARHLADLGYGSSSITILGALGGPQESLTRGTAEDWAHEDPAERLPAFHLIAIECRGALEMPLPRIPGLADAAYQGSPLPRDVRAAVLARLMPERNGVLWDVGCGAGDVAVEWMRAAQDAEAVGFDTEREALADARTNADRLGAPRLLLIEGTLPAASSDLPERKGTRLDLHRPQAVCLRAHAGETAIDHALDTLAPFGRIVVVAGEGDTLLHRLADRHDGELVRIAVSHPADLRTAPAAQFTLWSLLKGA